MISEIVIRHRDLAFPSNYIEKFPEHPRINLVRYIFDNPLWRVIGQKEEAKSFKFLNKIAFKPAEAYVMWDYLTSDHIDFSKNYLFKKKESIGRIGYIRSYFDAMVRLQNRKRLALKITGPPRIGFLLSIFPDAFFVNLKRETIPTISSFLAVNFWKTRGYSRLYWQGVYSDKDKKWAEEHADRPELLTALQLKMIDQVTRCEWEHYKPALLDVSYEDFTGNAKEVLVQITEFCGLDFDNEFEYYLANNVIENRNKADQEYFSDEQLEGIRKVLAREMIISSEDS